MDDLDADWSNGSYECEECPPGNKHPRRSKRGRAPKLCPDHRAAKQEAEKNERIDALRAARGRKPVDRSEKPEPEQTQEQLGVRTPTPEEREGLHVLPVPRPDEPTWLDDDDAQELLRQKRQREVDTGVTYDPDEHGTVDEFLAAPAVPVDAERAADHHFTAEDFATATERVNELRDQHRAKDPLTDVPIDTSTTADVDMGDGETPADKVSCEVSTCGGPRTHVEALCGPHWQKVGLDERNILLGTKPGSDAYEQTLRRTLYKLRS